MPATLLCLLVFAVYFTGIALASLVLLQPKDCQDILWSGSNISGVYTIYPQGTGGFKVYCDMKTDGGGWTVLQRRQNGKVGFYRYWKEYQYGFGDKDGEHWIGNQRIHQLTSQGWYELRVDMSDFKNKRRYAYYRIFSVGNKASGYKLTVGEYHGNAGDSLGAHNGSQFYSRDKDINSCSKQFKGGWWYTNCHAANLNGLYLKGSHSSFADGVNWYHWHGYHYSLKTTEMKIRRQ
uniref:Fibrinogen C domain-containing protein 1-like n=1 Tax=Crassostrea virginica TaxID=6565 RepID=A0A8B8DA87_CRAVI|nr:fibrinogen C domain-containing protein 1-like [Crassostrea virginica]XP_022324570.1 fibrinogen C domain-containing protein 1-like [Crassostrea virginica]XP_022324571.1 fibrinogen C domain-containing protein 1-like [Crassostrea virginica]